MTCLEHCQQILAFYAKINCKFISHIMQVVSFVSLMMHTVWQSQGFSHHCIEDPSAHSWVGNKFQFLLPLLPPDFPQSLWWYILYKLKLSLDGVGFNTDIAKDELMLFHSWAGDETKTQSGLKIWQNTFRLWLGVSGGKDPRGTKQKANERCLIFVWVLAEANKTVMI